MATRTQFFPKSAFLKALLVFLQLGSRGEYKVSVNSDTTLDGWWNSRVKVSLLVLAPDQHSVRMQRECCSIKSKSLGLAPCPPHPDPSVPVVGSFRARTTVRDLLRSSSTSKGVLQCFHMFCGNPLRSILYPKIASRIDVGSSFACSYSTSGRRGPGWRVQWLL